MVPQENSTYPNQEILDWFNIRVIAPLGGRQNRHWSVVSEKSTANPQPLVLRRWYTSADNIAYELRLLTRIAALGWPVAPAVGEPFEWGGYYWSLFPFLAGNVVVEHGSAVEQRSRGRLLAQFHRDLATVQDFGQRGTWRRCEEILEDPTRDQILADHEAKYPEEVPILRWHLERARLRISGLAVHNRPSIVVHGDFTPWNLRFQDGRLSGILDFELAHLDHRIGDFALSWRGKYDEVIRGYDEVSPLEPEEWALLTPLWWASLIENACRDFVNGTFDEGWTIQKLLTRSPLMGPDAGESL